MLRHERLGIVVPPAHPLALRRSVSWRLLAKVLLIVLARREGVGLHDAMMSSCRQAGFSPRVAYTPSLIGTVLSYVEAGAGIGIVPESVVTSELSVKFALLKPVASVQLVLAWQEHEDTPAVQRFRELTLEWQRAKKLWRS